MTKAVIFDFDDTLFRTKEIRIQAIINAGYRFYKLKLTKSAVKKSWGQPIHKFWLKLFGPVDSYENIMRNYLSIIPHYPNTPYPDALPTINNLITSYHLGIISSSARELIIPELTHHNFPLEKFFHIQTAEDTKVHKPDPEVFRPLINKLKAISINLHEVTYIGDSLHDYHAAKNAGIQFIGIVDRDGQKRHFQKAGAKTIKNLSELIHIL